LAEPAEVPLQRVLASDAGKAAFANLAPAEQLVLARDWYMQRRQKQLWPGGRWSSWLLLAGRGFGKTRSGAEWVKAWVEEARARRIALVGPTAADTRDVMVEGESGILAVSRREFRPVFERSKRRLVWPNGARAYLYSADRPDRLRGPQHDAAWCDELAAWRYEAAWHNLLLGLRLGGPRCVITTTPRPVRLVRGLVADAGVSVTRGATQENRANLPDAFIAEVERRFGGTRIGRQELAAELLEDVPGALWTRALFEREGMRVAAAPELGRIVVAIDPAASAAEDADETGIVVAGVARDGAGYVLADLSGRFSPPAWAARALAAYRDFEADRIVAETNFGGEMVEATLRALERGVPFKPVHASRGKWVRAEPVAALYEKGRVHHVGAFPALEDQLCNFAGVGAGPSPDRLDALVWALTDLMLDETPGAGILEWYRLQSERLRAGKHG
jgi:phage terminase large subunit-like protein